MARFARIPARAAAVRGFTVTTYRVLISISSRTNGTTNIAEVGNTEIAHDAGIRRDKVPAEAARIINAGLLADAGKGERGRRRYPPRPRRRLLPSQGTLSQGTLSQGTLRQGTLS